MRNIICKRACGELTSENLSYPKSYLILHVDNLRIAPWAHSPNIWTAPIEINVSPKICL